MTSSEQPPSPQVAAPYPALYDLVHQKGWTMLLRAHGDAAFKLRIYDAEGELRAGVKSTLVAPFCFVQLASWRSGICALRGSRPPDRRPHKEDGGQHEHHEHDHDEHEPQDHPDVRRDEGLAPCRDETYRHETPPTPLKLTMGRSLCQLTQPKPVFPPIVPCAKARLMSKRYQGPIGSRRVKYSPLDVSFQQYGKADVRRTDVPELLLIRKAFQQNPFW